MKYVGRVALGLVFSCWVPAAEVEGPAVKEPPAEAVEAWTKAVGPYGGMKLSLDGERLDVGDPPPKPGELPAFTVARFRPPWKKLPSLGVPFGLVFLSTPSAAELAAVADLPGLQGLRLRLDVKDGSLKRLAGIKGLRYLDITGNGVTDEGVKELSDMKLRELILPYKARTDRGLEHLLAATEPREKLVLRSWTVTDAGLKQLAGQGELRTLDLFARQITDEGLKELAGLEGLQYLSAPGGGVTDEGLKALAGMKDLRELAISDTKITDAGLKQSGGLSRLRNLYLNNAGITDAGLKELEGLKEVRLLSLFGTRTTAEGKKALQAALPMTNIRP